MAGADNPDTDPVDRNPREQDLSRRSRNPALSPWLVVIGLIILGAAVYAVSALL
jgi:hypothetical protein